MTNQQHRHVFISYVRENQDQVDHLARDLENHGVNVWLDRNDIKPGARWKAAVQEAIRGGNFFIACFSKEYTSKGKTHMNEELVLAIEELRKYPPDQEWFIPVLLSECDVPARSIGAGETLLDINWVPLYEDWESGIQLIIEVIKPISPEIQKLTSALLSKDSTVRGSATDALARVGSAAVPALIKALKDEDEGIRLSAVYALKKMGSSAKEAVPFLINALKDEDVLVRSFAEEALIIIRPAAKNAVPFLIKALKDDDKKVRENVAFALIGIGPEAVPALLVAPKDEYVNVRQLAAEALREIGPEAKAAVPALIEVLKDEYVSVRRLAAGALREIGPEAKKAVPALTEALKDPSKYVCSYSAKALKKINTPEAQKALEKYYNESD